MTVRLGAIAVAALVVLAPLSASAQKPFTLKFLTAWDDRYEGTKFIAYRYAEMVKKASSDRIKFHFSGPEVVKFKQQLQPTSSGVFDLNLSVGPYFFGTTGLLMAYYALPPDTEMWRKEGYWQTSDAEFNRFNLTLLTHTLGGSGSDIFHILLKEPVDKADIKPLAGRKIRANIFYKPVVEPLGGSIVTLSGGEIYSALQKGVVEGAAWPVLGAVNFKWYEVTKYMTRPRFGSSPYVVYMNTDRFKKLSSADRQLLLKIGRDLEHETPKVFDAATKKEIETLKGFGVKETHLHPEAAKKITVGHQRGIWNLALSQKTSKERTMELYKKAFAKGHAPKLEKLSAQRN